MSLNNFRQFKGEQKIVFAEGNLTSNAPCITVLYGENGRGKTGIYRALMFGLYGDSTLSQDEQTKSSELNLVNRHLLEAKPEEPIKAVVTIEFTHNRCSYNLHREISGMKKKDGKIVEQLGEALLRIQDENGNTTSHSEPEDILQKINAVLDYRVREYFLFDGEKIERLTRASNEQRKEVSAGIRNLLNIDDLEKTIRAAEKLSRELDQDVRKKSSGELQQVIQSINEKEDRIQRLQEQIDSIDAELTQLGREKRDIDEKLEQYQEIRGLVEERKKVELQREELRERLVILESDCRQKTSKSCLSIIQPALQAVFNYIDVKREKGDIPPILRSDLIQDLLDKHECICGRELLEGSEPFKKLIEWMSKTPKSSETDAALLIWKQLGAILREMPEQQREAKNHLMQYADNKDKLHRLDTRLEKITEQIGTNERADAVHFEEQRLKIEKRHISLLVNQKKYHDDVENTRLELNELERKRQLLENDASIRDTLIRRSQMIREIKDALKNVFNSFKIEAAKELGKYATKIMERLLDDEGRRNLKEIIVEDNYSLQITDQWNGQFLANISAGQRQIMSIAFITALAKSASGDSILEMPLFMDTPFGRLSQEHRNNLIREIPKLSSQWVLLATDTELRREEGQALLSEKRLGKFYRLSAQPDGTTTINEQSLKDVPVLLKTTMETNNV